MFSAHRTGQGPFKTSTAHTWSGCLLWLGDGEVRRGKCEEVYKLTQPEPGAWVPSCFLPQTGSPGSQVPSPSDLESWVPEAPTPSFAGVQALALSSLRPQSPAPQLSPPSGTQVASCLPQMQESGAPDPFSLGPRSLDPQSRPPSDPRVLGSKPILPRHSEARTPRPLLSREV